MRLSSSLPFNERIQSVVTRPQKSRYPVSSFGPELMAILLKGATERVEIPCPSMRVMQALQLRIQMLRGAMGRENHPQYTLSCRARTSRTWDKDSDPKGERTSVLVIQPNDSQFTDLLTAAGVTVTEVHRDILEETSAPEGVPNDPSLEPGRDDTPEPATVFNPLDPYSRFK